LGNNSAVRALVIVTFLWVSACGEDATEAPVIVPQEDVAPPPQDDGPPDEPDVAEPDIAPDPGPPPVPDDGPPLDVPPDVEADVPPPPPPPPPGNVVLHRLNRAEYNNTVADLLLTDLTPADGFPADDHSFGFDNIASVLAMSPLLFEKMELAAEQLIDDALFLAVYETSVIHLEAEDVGSDKGGASGSFWNLWTNGTIEADVEIEEDGVYLIRVKAGETAAGPDTSLMMIALDDLAQTVPVAGTPAAPGVYTMGVYTTAGTYTVSASFLNDFYEPDQGLDRNLLVDWISVEGPFPSTTVAQTIEVETLNGPGQSQGAFRVLAANPTKMQIVVAGEGTHELSMRAYAVPNADATLGVTLQIDGAAPVVVPVTGTAEGPQIVTATVQLSPGAHVVGLSNATPGQGTVAVDYFTTIGTLDLPIPEVSEKRAAIMICDPAEVDVAACAAEILTAFGRRAWRRPTTGTEIDRLVALVLLAISEGGDFEEGIRVALKAVMLSPHFLYRVEIDPELGAEEPHLITDYELAARLSYGIWSSMPDKELSDLADAGLLQDPAVIDEQVRRMLADPRASALMDNFVGQWLELRALEDVIRDGALFPDFDAELAAAMRTETELMLTDAIHGAGSFLDILDSDVTYVNDRLAALYGMDIAEIGADFVSAPTASQRAGILTHASFLTLTSHVFRTSPVKRGKFVLGQLQCSSPPPPPDNVVTALEIEGQEPTTVKALLAKHREDPMCAGCHDALDPVGLAFENFDAIGAWRTEDNGFPIDPSGTLQDGTEIGGYMDLIELLKADPLTARCVSQQLFVYMLGRGVLYDDQQMLDEVSEAWADKGFVLEELLVLLAQTDQFRMRLAPEVPPPEPEEPEEGSDDGEEVPE